jgi:hypothetical protein
MLTCLLPRLISTGVKIIHKPVESGSSRLRLAGIVTEFSSSRLLAKAGPALIPHLGAAN